MTPEEEAAQAAEALKATQVAEAETARIAALPENDPARVIATLNSENAKRRINEKALQDKLDKISSAKREADEQAAAEKGEFENLYTGQKGELEAATAKLGTMTAALQKVLDAEVALMPENMRALVPAGDVASQLEWVAVAKAAKLFETPGGPGVKTPGEDGPNSLEAQLAEATKTGNVGACISLKRQIAEKQH